MQSMTTADAVARIEARPKPPFLYTHDPDAWEAVEVDGSPYWLPVLGVMPLRPGCAGVRTIQASEDPSDGYKDAVRDREDRGVTVLPMTTHVDAEHLPEGVPAGPYIRSIPCRDAAGNPGVRHIEAWNVPVKTPKGREQVFRFDRATHDKWRMHLVASGVIEPPTEAVTSYVQRLADGHVARAQVMQIPEEIREQKVSAAKKASTKTATAKAPARKKRGTK